MLFICFFYTITVAEFTIEDFFFPVNVKSFRFLTTNIMDAAWKATWFLVIMKMYLKLDVIYKHYLFKLTEKDCEEPNTTSPLHGGGKLQ